MTDPIAPNPQPTAGSRYDSYLIPRSRTPEKTELYEKLLELGWRFDSHYMTWHTPESDTLQGFGRLEFSPQFTWAKVQPPTPITEGELDQLLLNRPPALIKFSRANNEWIVE